MITELEVRKHTGAFAYAAKLPILGKPVVFQPGLNILVGPTGSGKSTVLAMLARYLAAYQGGVSAVTNTWVSDSYDMIKKRSKFGFSVKHDGRPILYGNPRTAIGLAGGAFDDDFFEQGLQNVVMRGSTWEFTMHRLAGLLAVLNGSAEFPTEIDRLICKEKVNNIWAAAINALEPNLAATVKRGPPTILIDGPESGLSVPLQARLWAKLASVQNFQLIVATHSPFAVGIAGANYIEMEPGYMEQSQRAVFAWADRVSAYRRSLPPDRTVKIVIYWRLLTPIPEEWLTSSQYAADQAPNGDWLLLNVRAPADTDPSATFGETPPYPGMEPRVDRTDPKNPEWVWVFPDNEDADEQEADR